MARYADDEEFASSCLADARRMKAAAADAFWNGQRAAYQTYIGEETQPHFAELTQSLALLAGVADCERGQQIRSLLMSPENSMVATTLSQSLYKFEAVLMDEANGPWVRDRIARDWSAMLFAGASSFWETLKGGWDFHHSASLCHGWSGIPVYFYGAYGLGVKPLTPGFTEFSLRPSLKMSDAKGIVPTPRGNITIATLPDTKTEVRLESENGMKL